MRRQVLGVLVVVLLACGGAPEGVGPDPARSTAPLAVTHAAPATTTTARDVPTSRAPADTIPTSTATVPVTTTGGATTSPPGGALVLRHDGIGPFEFGEEADAVAEGLISVLGAPSDDAVFDCTDQVLPHGYGCLTSLRILNWSGLFVVMSDAAYFREGGIAHFAGWAYRGGDSPDLRTAQGVGVGSSVGDLQEAFGDRLHLPEAPDECGNAWVWRVCDRYPPESSLGCLGGTLTGNPAEDGVAVSGLDAGARASC